MIGPETVFLCATDTTIGFLSQSRTSLDRIKNRPDGKPYITVLPSLHALQVRLRTPKRYHRRIRRSKRVSFIFPQGESYRIVWEPRHLLLLDRLGWAHSTSANPAGKPYDETFALDAADVVVEPLKSGRSPSRILQLGKRRIRRLR